jgi:hypothetical protein
MSTLEAAQPKQQGARMNLQAVVNQRLQLPHRCKLRRPRISTFSVGRFHSNSGIRPEPVRLATPELGF